MRIAILMALACVQAGCAATGSLYVESKPGDVTQAKYGAKLEFKL